MHVVVVTAQKQLLDQECQSVVLPTAMGQIEVLTDHAALLTKLALGTIRLQQASQNPVTLSITAGLAQVKNNHIHILAEINEAIGKV